MPHKKNAESESSPEQDALIKRVDQMMDLSLPDMPPESPPEAEKSSAPPTIQAVTAPVDAESIDIFNDSKTAPEVSPGLLQKIGVNKTKPKKVPTPPKTHRKTKSSHKTANTDEIVSEIMIEESDRLLSLQDAVDQAAPAYKPRVKRHAMRNYAIWFGVAIVTVVILLLVA